MTGRSATGVIGIRLAPDDEVVGLVCMTPDDQRYLLTVTTKGYGKLTPLSEYLVQSESGATRVQSRGGKGRRDIITTGRNGPVVGLLAVNPEDDLMLISVGGLIVRITAGSVRRTARGTLGVRVIKLSSNDHLADVAQIAEDTNDKKDQTEQAQDPPPPPDAPLPPDAE